MFDEIPSNGVGAALRERTVARGPTAVVGVALNFDVSDVGVGAKHSRDGVENVEARATHDAVAVGAKVYLFGDLNLVADDGGESRRRRGRAAVGGGSSVDVAGLVRAAVLRVGNAVVVAVSLC